MSDLSDLLIYVRQHRAFGELLNHIEAPKPRPYRQSGEPDKQYAEWIFNSGAAKQHTSWLMFLIGESPEGETNPSSKEKS